MDIREFLLTLLRNLFVVGVVGVYYIALVYFINLFLKALDYIFRG
ncbi:hypothetical protein [Clostridium tertium]|jgi:hypothetical protein|nr:hypothetical protein [Clostridium tertium]